jgi:hypothetical protein
MTHATATAVKCNVGAAAVVMQVGDAMRCPATKFITHTLSNLSFVILLAMATFRLDDRSYPITTVEDLVARRFDETVVSPEEQVECLLRNTFRPANVLMTNIQICILFWVLGKQRVIYRAAKISFSYSQNPFFVCYVSWNVRQMISYV